jgi:fluoroacetyl-CoA thioesterase
MKQLFSVGDKTSYSAVVTENDVARFQGELVHPVLATFSLARDIEWTTRRFVLQMREEEEEGIGTFVNIEHKGPAFIGETVSYTGCIERIIGNEIVCSVDVRVGDRLVAVATTGQKILPKAKLRSIFKQS